MNVRHLLLMLVLVGQYTTTTPTAFGDNTASVLSTMRAVHLAGSLVHVNGSPASDATVTVDVLNRSFEQIQTLAYSEQIKPDSQGRYVIDLKLDESKNQIMVAIATGSGTISPISSYRSNNQPTVLQPITHVNLHLIGDDGKPIVGATVSPRYFVVDEGTSSDYVYWYNADQRWTAVSDANGIAVINNLPSNYPMTLTVDGDRYVQPDDKIEMSTSTASFDQNVKLSLNGSVSGKVIFWPGGRPATGMRISAAGINDNDGQPSRGYATTDSDGNYTISQVSPGNYYIEFDGIQQTGLTSLPQPIWAAVAVHVNVKPGDGLGGVNLTLFHGAVLSGTVTNKYTGKPDADILVRSNGPDHPANYVNEASATTGADGTYQLCLAPGDHSVFASTTYGGVLPPEDYVRSITLAEGESKTQDFVVPDPGTPTNVSGTVYGPTGKPAAHVAVSAIGGGTFDNDAMTDDVGRFTFQEPGIFPIAKIYAHSGLLTSALSPVVGTSQNIVLRLAAHIGCSISGRVIDIKGRPVVAAEIDLFRESADGGGTFADRTKTDTSGLYTFPAELASGQYQISASCKWYAPPSSMAEVVGSPGEAVHVSPILMNISDSFVGGKVLDSNGAPMAGAVVADLQNRDNRSTTDSTGKFFLQNVPERQVILFVIAADGRQTASQVSSGSTTQVVTIPSQ